jgi:hypothetical protein
MRGSEHTRSISPVTVFALALAACIAWTPDARADLPPFAYRDMQKKAPEHLQIEVLSVQTVERKDAIDVRAEARVTAVVRSASGLEPGRVIRIVYSHSTKIVAGPRSVPVLQEKKSYPAFLQKSESGDTYEPAAGGRSFEVVEDR